MSRYKKRKERGLNIGKKESSTIKITTATIRTSVGDPLGLLDPDPLVRGTSGSFPFIINVLSRLKYRTEITLAK
jgi:hypothetical protein